MIRCFSEKPWFLWSRTASWNQVLDTWDIHCFQGFATSRLKWRELREYIYTHTHTHIYTTHISIFLPLTTYIENYMSSHQHLQIPLIPVFNQFPVAAAASSTLLYECPPAHVSSYHSSSYVPWPLASKVATAHNQAGSRLCPPSFKVLIPQLLPSFLPLSFIIFNQEFLNLFLQPTNPLIPMYMYLCWLISDT